MLYAVLFLDSDAYVRTHLRLSLAPLRNDGRTRAFALDDGDERAECVYKRVPGVTHNTPMAELQKVSP